ncbi:hypothetical protein EJ060_18755, partial [Acinetobacter baumannii]
ALDKHRESLKNLFKELFHDREIKTENGGPVNPIIVKFKKDKPVAKAQFSDATQYLDSGFETPHYQYYYKHADKTQLVQFSELPVFFQAILDAEV